MWMRGVIQIQAEALIIATYCIGNQGSVYYAKPALRSLSAVQDFGRRALA